MLLQPILKRLLVALEPIPLCENLIAPAILPDIDNKHHPFELIEIPLDTIRHGRIILAHLIDNPKDIQVVAIEHLREQPEILMLHGVREEEDGGGQAQQVEQVDVAAQQVDALLVPVALADRQDEVLEQVLDFLDACLDAQRVVAVQLYHFAEVLAGHSPDLLQVFVVDAREETGQLPLGVFIHRSDLLVYPVAVRDLQGEGAEVGRGLHWG